MPKVVNYVEQREKIAEAAWRVICKGGLEQATVRKIADEAGVSMGAMRHYFNSQAQMLEFAMNLIVERVETRIQKLNLFSEGVTVQAAQSLILQFMPMNEERVSEMEVWIAFTVKSLNDPTLKQLSHRTFTQMQEVMLNTLQLLVRERILDPSIDVLFEAQKLHALVDGLSIHRLIQPDTVTPERMEAAIGNFFAGLALKDGLSPK